MGKRILPLFSLLTLCLLLPLAGCEQSGGYENPMHTDSEEETNNIEIVSSQATLSDEAKIEIDDRMENVIAQDGTNCTMIFEMEAESVNGVFKGQAMLQSIGVKDAEGSIPATGMIGLVSKTEFTLEPSTSKEQSTDNEFDEIDLEPLTNVDYRAKGSFRFIMTDVGFMALETKIQEDDMFLDVPFEITVVDDKVGISFNAPDGQFLSFQGKLQQN